MNVFTKRTNYHDSISFGENEIIKIAEADVVRVISQTTGQHIADLDPHEVLEGGKQIPITDRETGRFKCFSYYRLFKF